MSKSFLDTTVVVDSLLGQRTRKQAVRAVVASYSESEVPEYAFREFSAGPLWYWVYAYNVVAATRTLEDAVAQLSRVAAFRARAGWGGVTAIMRGLIRAAEIGPIEEEDPRQATLGYMLREIQKAWATRRSVAKRSVHPLACFHNGNFEIRDGALRSDTGAATVGCDSSVPCSAAEQLRKQRKAVERLVEALRPAKGETQKPESSSRRHALKEVLKSRPGEFPKKKCRALGDAYFCIVAPTDSEILTSNVSDFAPLAKALGKKVRSV